MSIPTGPSDDRLDYFISYAQADRAWAEGFLRFRLTAVGLRCATERDFPPGSNRLEDYERAIDRCERVLIVLSPAYVTNEALTRFLQVMAQTVALETAQYKVIPVVREAVQLETIPVRLRPLNRVEMTDDASADDAIGRLLQTAHVQPVAAMTHPPCPFPGMVSFSEAQSDRFFGRDREIRALLDSLHDHPFIAVIGASGSGKSSLVAAGLLPAIQSSHLFGAGSWQTAIMRPGRLPFVALAAALKNSPFPDDPAVRDAAIDHVLTTRTGSRLLLVIDQFEEIFGGAAAVAVAFMQTLDRLRGQPGVYIVIVVRADFYPDLMASPLWEAIRAHRLELALLDLNGLRAAILTPAEKAGVYIEAALIERLLADSANEPGSLPLIQETLVLLWDRLEARYLSVSAYERLVLVLPRSAYQFPAVGMTPRELTGLQVAIVRRAEVARDALVERFGAQADSIGQRIFLRLIQFGEGRDDTRRQQPYADLIGTDETTVALSTAIALLTDRRLLTLGGSDTTDGVRTVDIAHEALIRAWPRLRQWIAERKAAELKRRSLRASAEDWERRSGAGGLLDSSELLDAERWLAEAEAAELGAPADTLIAAWITASRRSTERAKQNARLQRMIGIALGLTIITAIVLGLFARAQAQIARSRQISAEALTVSVEQPLCALTLAHAALAVQNTIEARSVLLTARSTNGLAQAIIPAAASVTAVGFGANGAWLAIASGTTIQIRPMRDGQPGDPFTMSELNSSQITALAVDPRGRWLAVATWDMTSGLGAIEVWPIAATYEQPGIQPGVAPITLLHSDSKVGGQIDVLAVSPDGTMLAAGDAFGVLHLWDMHDAYRAILRQTPTLPPIVPPTPTAVSALAFSPDGSSLAIARGTQPIVVWHPASDAPPTTLMGGIHLNTVMAVTFDRSNRLASADRNGTIILWDMNSGSKPTSWAANYLIRTALFSPDGTRLAVAGDQGTITLFGLNNWQKYNGAPPVYEFPLQGHGQRIVTLAFDPHNLLASGGLDNRVILWKPIDLNPLVTAINFHDTCGHPHCNTFFSPATVAVDGSAVAIGDDHGLVWVAPVDGGKPTLISQMSGAPITALVFDPTDPDRLAAGDQGGSVRLWDRIHGTAIKLLTGSVPIHMLAFDATGSRLAIATVQGGVTLWDVASRTQSAVIQADQPAARPVVYITALAFDHTGRQIALGASDGSVRIWDSTTAATAIGQPAPSLTVGMNDQTPISGLAFAADDRSLTAAASSGALRIWSGSVGALFAQLPQIVRVQPNLNRAAFSADGTLMALSNTLEGVSLWDRASRTRLGIPLTGQIGDSLALDFSGSGLVYASDQTGQVFLWHFAPDAPPLSSNISAIDLAACPLP